MESLFPFLVPISLFVSIAAVAILRGPLGKALAQRLAQPGGGGGSAAEVEALRGEMDDLRFRLTELEERLDFAERMLARQRDPNQLPPG